MLNYFNIIIFFVLLIFLLLATCFDLKKRIIPNKLVLIFLIISIFLFLIKLFISFSYSFLFNNLLSILITFLMCFLLWEFGVIAGGDLKLFFVVSILLPYNLSLFSNLSNFSLNYSFLKYPIFAVILLLASFFMLLPYILSYSLLNLFYKKNILFLKEEFFNKANLNHIFYCAVSLYLVSSVLNLFNASINFFILFFCSFVFYYLILLLKKKRLSYFFGFLTVGYVFLLIATFITKKQLFSFIDLLLIVFFTFVVSLFLFLLKLIKTNVLTTETELSKLTEGVVLSNNYYYDSKKNTLLVEKINFFNHLKRLIAGTYYTNLKIDSNKAGGLTSQDIAFLNTMYENNLISSKIYIKKTLPFMPVVLITFIILNFIKF